MRKKQILNSYEGNILTDDDIMLLLKSGWLKGIKPNSFEVSGNIGLQNVIITLKDNTTFEAKKACML